MDDLISRQDAIRIASGYCHPANIADELRKLPSAQPETQLSAEDATFDTTFDCISRQAAIEAVSTMFAPTPTQMDMREDCLEILENLPSAQPYTNDALEDAYAHGYTYAESKFREILDAQPEIIRCKDCVYYDPTDNDDEESDWCHVWGDTTEGNAFCSYAKRKGEQP